jgi:tRNA A37 threonylcarbamoyltransferase TsaD
MRYIRQLCTAIFVIPTVPTIRRSEEVFIRGAWSSFSSAIFVQNRWDDETDQEVNDSVAFNSLVLKNIAKNANTTFNGKICVVNAYRAILSRLHNDSAECKRSNLPELLTELENLGKNRINLETANFKAKVGSYIEAAQAAIMQYIAESQMSEEQLRAERERICEEFNTATNEIQQLVNDVLKCVEDEKNKADICASFQKALIDILMDKLIKAAKHTGIRQITIGGGVSANSGLRARIEEEGRKRGWTTFLPEFKFTTDNAAMIAIAGWFHYQNGERASLDVAPVSRLAEF